MLLSFGSLNRPQKKEEYLSVVNLEAPKGSEDTPEPSRAEPAKTASPQPTPEEPQPPQPAKPLPPQVPQPQAAPPVPTPSPQPPAPATPRIGVRPPGGKVFGPPNVGGGSSSRDSERVGTAPNGDALYAATWYREPKEDELRGYLSTASGPGWGLIACRTAPDYRVEDCVGLDEYPNGSQINRAVLAAAWQFQVRPPRLGGKLMVGAWVRIRIDYQVKRR